METLKIDKNKAVKLFKNVPDWFKETLIDTFGKETFSGKIMDRVKTLNDAIAEADEETRRKYLQSIEGYNTPDEIAYKQKKIICKILRCEWEPDWNDGNQKKWYPWFRWSAGSGFDFAHSYFDFGNSDSIVGSRLCFPDKETSDYFGKQFIDIHRTHLT